MLHVGPIKRARRSFPASSGCSQQSRHGAADGTQTEPRWTLISNTLSPLATVISRKYESSFGNEASASCSGTDVRLRNSGSDLVSQELARQRPEGVQGQEPARQVHQLELLHFRVDEQLSGGQRGDPWSGGVGDVHPCKYREGTGSDPPRLLQGSSELRLWELPCL